MRLGFVSTCTSGAEAALARAVLDIFRSAEHDCFAYETEETTQGGDDGEYDVTGAAGAAGGEYAAWALRNGLRAVFFFDDPAFTAIAAMRRTGVVTIGAFPWERFSDEQVGRALAAYDCIYSFHDAQTARYARLGLLAPRVRLGAPPDLVQSEWEAKAPYAPVVFLYLAPGPEQIESIAATVKAFSKADCAQARLVVRPAAPVAESARLQAPNVSWREPRMVRGEALALLRASDVCLVNSRWDGLALCALEAIGAGLPLLCPDAAPWNEHVRHGLTGLALECSSKPKGPGGIPDVEVAPRAITDAVRRLADRRVVAAMTQNTQHLRDADYVWERTRADYLHLLEYALSRRR